MHVCVPPTMGVVVPIPCADAHPGLLADELSKQWAATQAQFAIEQQQWQKTLTGKCPVNFMSHQSQGWDAKLADHGQNMGRAPTLHLCVCRAAAHISAGGGEPKTSACRPSQLSAAGRSCPQNSVAGHQSGQVSPHVSILVAYCDYVALLEQGLS